MILSKEDFLMQGLKVSSDDPHFVEAAIRAVELTVVIPAIGETAYVMCRDEKDPESEMYVAREGSDTVGGLKAAIAHLAYEVMLNDTAAVTRFGSVRKTDEHSQPLDSETLQNVAYLHHTIGWGYLKQVAKYLGIELSQSSNWML